MDYKASQIIMLLQKIKFNVCEAHINQVRRTSDIMHYELCIMHFSAIVDKHRKIIN